MRKTKIICTIGPSCQDEETIEKLIKAGMNVARLNFSHGDHKGHEETFRKISKIRNRLDMPVAILLDTKGPEIRLRDFKGGKAVLKTGQEFTLTTEDVLGDEHRATISFPGLVNDVKPGDGILMDDGLIGMKVKKAEGTEIVCEVLNGGAISNKKGINVPNVDVSMPFISEQDKSDIEFGCRLGFDFIACSFTRSADDIREVRKILDENGSRMQVIAKIENIQGVRNIEDIIEAADGVMVARGDLGVEVPMEDFPILQKRIIRKAYQQGKIVITATQMLDSMIHNPRPTRAEATDVANAIYDGTTATMLSGETASGAYPIQAVDAMSRIAQRAEQEMDYSKEREEVLKNMRSRDVVTTAITHSACSTADEVNASAIVAVTMTGFTARRLAHYRPGCPVLACTPDAVTARQLNLEFGVIPMVIGIEEREDQLFGTAIERAYSKGLLKKDDRIVLVAGLPLGRAGNTNTMRVMEVKDFL